MNLSSPFFFKTINIDSIKFLNSKVESRLIDKTPFNYENSTKFDFSYVLNDMKSWLNNNFDTGKKIQEKIFISIEPYLVSVKEYNLIIKKHNKTINMPTFNEYLLEKKAFLEWRSFNTPSLKDLKITPLFGTGFYDEILNNSNSISSSIYDQWKVALHYLIWEYNILKKALYYMDNENSNLSYEYKEAYVFWMNRQLEYIDLKYMIGNKAFIIDFTIDRDNLYREVCEDYLYVLLNILLANSVINNLDLKFSINNENLFFDLLKSIINLHYEEFKSGYICLNELRIYSSNYCLSVNQLKLFNKDITKE